MFCYFLVMVLQDNALAYLLNFLCGSESEAAGSAARSPLRIGYTADPVEMERYDLVFVPSGFFTSGSYGSKESLPRFRLPEIEGIPFLFGSNRVERKGETLIVHADLPASAFCFLSRYEEFCHPEMRDLHGRFNARWSLLSANGFLSKPLVDEYTGLIKRLLRETGRKIPANGGSLSKLWLTHDVDAPFYCQGLRSFAREALKGKGLGTALRLAMRNPESDPYYTFQYFFDMDSFAASRCPFPVESIYFLKGGGGSVYDKPVYGLASEKMRHLLWAIRERGARIGLHGSYSSGKTGQVLKEKACLERAIGENVTLFRQHYLRSCEPCGFNSLEKAGIRDDFTMGYPDAAGFRLGTCRPVRWIDPACGRLSNLWLHPLAIMDNTLFQESYMGLSFAEAEEYCLRLVEQVRIHGGELCLLWHNNNVSVQDYPENPVPWIRLLYSVLIDCLCGSDR